MASSTEERQIAFKHTLDVYGVRSDRQWFEEPYGAKHVTVAPDVWASKPPFNNPASAVLQGLAIQEAEFSLTLDPFSAGRLWVAKSSPEVWPYAGPQTDWTVLETQRVKNWISPSVFGMSYQFVLKQGDGTLIPTGNWEWNFSEGLLHLDDGFSASEMGWVVPLKMTCYRYTGAFLSEGVASWYLQEWSTTEGQISFILDYPISVVDSLEFSVNGVEYDLGTDFVRSGQTVTWLNSQFVIEAGDHVVARFLKG